jgi:hypothetical protein
MDFRLLIVDAVMCVGRFEYVSSDSTVVALALDRWDITVCVANLTDRLLGFIGVARLSWTPGRLYSLCTI